MKIISSIFLLLIMAVYAANTQAEIAIIANKSVSIASITEAQAAAIFLSQLDVLEDGTQLIPVDQKDDQETRSMFYAKVIKKGAAQLNAYWSRKVFSGEGQPPKKVADDAVVLALVRANPNVIGYVDAAAVNNSVKVLLRIP
ncbi:MAG: phosphate ABC transporter substrate-binding protein [Cellvibrionales bacterium]|nr:phosphate ABC transporter substrate-binding protein [Cellvibrionales bacterium]